MLQHDGGFCNGCIAKRSWHISSAGPAPCNQPMVPKCYKTVLLHDGGICNGKTASLNKWANLTHNCATRKIKLKFGGRMTLFLFIFHFLLHTFIQSHSFNTFIRRHSPRSFSISSSLESSVGNQKPPCGSEPRIELGLPYSKIELIKF